MFRWRRRWRASGTDTIAILCYTQPANIVTGEGMNLILPDDHPLLAFEELA